MKVIDRVLYFALSMISWVAFLMVFPLVFLIVMLVRLVEVSE